MVEWRKGEMDEPVIKNVNWEKYYKGKKKTEWCEKRNKEGKPTQTGKSEEFLNKDLNWGLKIEKEVTLTRL